MLRSLAKFSELDASNHSSSLADFTTTTPELKFSVHTVIPPKANSAFVAAMEDVLAVYTRPRDPDRPLVCLDEPQSNCLPKRVCRYR